MRRIIVETTENRFFLARETGDRALAHLLFGVEMRRTKDGDFESKPGARETLVRKAAATVLRNVEP
jgi:hypothetical protein